MGAVDSSASVPLNVHCANDRTLSQSVFRRYVGDFTNVTVLQYSSTSWSIPFDTLTYLANGQNQSVADSIASVDPYRSYTYLSLLSSFYSMLVAQLVVYFADSDIQVTTDTARQIYSGIPGSQAISNTSWSLPCNSTFPLTLTFAGRPFTMYERDTIVKQANGTCTGVVTGGAQMIGKVGAPFLRNVYTFVPSSLYCIHAGVMESCLMLSNCFLDILVWPRL